MSYPEFDARAAVTHADTLVYVPMLAPPPGLISRKLLLSYLQRWHARQRRRNNKRRRFALCPRAVSQVRQHTQETCGGIKTREVWHAATRNPRPCSNDTTRF